MSRLVSHTGKRNITIRSSSRIADNKGPDTHCTPQAKPVKPPPTHTVHQIGIQLLSTTTAELPVEPMLVDDSVDYLNGPAEAAGTSVERYWSTLSFIGGAFRLDPNLFVLQDWDENLQTMKLGIYWHIMRAPHGPDDVGISCTCPRWKANGLCIHHHIVSNHYLDLLSLPALSNIPIPPAVYLHTTPYTDVHIFSCVSSTDRYQSGKRVIVSYQIDGRWHCQSCRYAPTCKHRQYAVDFANIIKLDVVTAGEDKEPSVNDDEVALQKVLKPEPRSSVSHIRVAPPRWCSLRSDTSFIEPQMWVTGAYFNLDNSSRCSCGYAINDTLRFTEPATFISTTVFGLVSSSLAFIEVLLCPSCRHRQRRIGPDMGCHGVFNWNNTLLFTHQLLNSYTSAFTASETPFSAFCTTVRRSYEESSSINEFCSDETFVHVWFAYIQLQNLDSSMTCPTCGPNPSIVIADGVSLTTHISKVPDSIRPPTHTDDTSENVTTITSSKAKALPAIPQKDIRSIIIKLLDFADDNNPPVSGKNMDTSLQKLVEKYRDVAGLLQLALHQNTSIPFQKAYRNLLRQLAAPDIILQLVPYPAIPLLRKLCESGTSEEWLPSLCPALGYIVNLHRTEGSMPNIEVRRVAGWLADRAQTVFDALSQHDPAPPSTSGTTSEGNSDWIKSGACYGLPSLRRRRIYSGLLYDAHKTDRSANEVGDCNKFYKTYSRNNLSGGILVLWCTHSICLGFHTIPTAEGRNDVFAAIYTHFAVAPQVIIYDFACQLAHYSLVREARYFAHTRFLIDELHAHDHTRCGRACFASNVMQYDERIRAVNTSAAECGNKGIKRIRKSVSFMSYEHAVIYTKAFLDVWNRLIIRQMGKAT